MKRQENKDKVEVFANHVKELTVTFSSKAKDQKTRREKTWGLYHSIHTSASFIGLWVKLLQQSVGMEPLPTFYQHVTDQIFHDLVRQHFPVQLTESTEEANWLGHQEANAIRYVAGYVCRSLRKKITSSSSLTPAQETLPTDVEQDGYCLLSTFFVSLLSTCQFDSFMGTPTFEYTRNSAKTLPILVGEQMVAKIWRTLTVSS